MALYAFDGTWNSRKDGEDPDYRNGLGFLGNQLLNLGHRLEVPESGVRYCFHALALDEQRLPFIPTRLAGAHEV